jgi:UDP-N-acetylmuramyl pentapeptide phosphotransferase/UDP-N-acetylglucosamine-1-phosphate transferase
VIDVATAAAGVLSVVVALRLLPQALRRAPHARPNYRGRSVLGTAGIVLVVPLVLGAVAALVSGDDADIVLSMSVVGVVLAVLGYLDDVRGDRGAGGFAGHVRELVHGRITTGLVKAAGGGVVGLLAAWATGWRGVWLIVAGAVVALSANLTNLLDLRPGRALKVWPPCAGALLIAGLSGRRVLLAVAGGAVAFLVEELRERVMLGDTGAGLVGGVIGVAAVTALDRTALVVVLAILVALTLVSEIVSFTRVIEAVPPLRWADRLGRRDG